MTLDRVLSIIDGSIKLANKVADAMTPEQKAAFIAWHEARMARWEAIVDKLTARGDGATP